MILIDKMGGWNKLSQEEINNIINTYKETGSIFKTSKKLGYAKNTVNKYVKFISKYNNIEKEEVCKIDPVTGKIIRTFKNANTAAKLCHISASNLSQCINGRTQSAGGFCWCYKNNYNAFSIPKSINCSYVRQEDILLSLK